MLATVARSTSNTTYYSQNIKFSHKRTPSLIVTTTPNTNGNSKLLGETTGGTVRRLLIRSWVSIEEVQKWTTTSTYYY